MAVKVGWQGRFYEDFEVDDTYRHPLGRTITETDNIWFTLLTCNTNMTHFNADYSGTTEFKQYLVNSALTMSLVGGLSVSDISENAVANLGWDEVRLPNPVFVGDTIYAESTVLSKRKSESRPYAGIVSFKTRGFKQDGTTVIEYKRTAMIYTKDGSPRFRPADEEEPTAILSDGAGGGSDD
jgi:itaconyl-CoA hydratase